MEPVKGLGLRKNLELVRNMRRRMLDFGVVSS